MVTHINDKEYHLPHDYLPPDTGKHTCFNYRLRDFCILKTYAYFP